MSNIVCTEYPDLPWEGLAPDHKRVVKEAGIIASHRHPTDPERRADIACGGLLMEERALMERQEMRRIVGNLHDELAERLEEMDDDCICHTERVALHEARALLGLKQDRLSTIKEDSAE